MNNGLIMDALIIFFGIFFSVLKEYHDQKTLNDLEGQFKGGGSLNTQLAGTDSFTVKC
jgi:hypothetical protein